ncbi:hypothetical protein GCM10028804_10500 [Larkinella terrae]
MDRRKPVDLGRIPLYSYFLQGILINQIDVQAGLSRNQNRIGSEAYKTKYELVATFRPGDFELAGAG